jgi:hypothetical protein
VQSADGASVHPSLSLSASERRIIDQAMMSSYLSSIATYPGMVHDDRGPSNEVRQNTVALAMGV